MPSTIVKEIQAYKWEELDDRAKNNARDKYFYAEDFHYLHGQDIIDWFKDEKLEPQGITANHIWYSGFYSQGDGACIDGDIDLRQLIKYHKLGNKYRRFLHWSDHGECEYTFRIRGVERGYYSRIDVERTVYPYAMNDAQEKALEAQIKELLEWAQEVIEDMNHEVYIMLLNEYEYITSDEYIQESCDANGYLFDEYGDMI